MALASTSAQVIPLPGAAAAPVINQPHTRGRYALGITPLSRGKILRRERMAAERKPALPAPGAWPLQAANPSAWPFGYVRRDQFALLTATDRAEIEGYIMGRVIHRQAGRHV